MLSLPALPSDKDQSLTVALSPLLAEYEASHPHVTAVRRLAAVAAQYAPFPDATRPAARPRRCGRAASSSSTRIRRRRSRTRSPAATSSSSRRRRRARRSATTRRCSTRSSTTRRRARCICFRRRRSRRISWRSCTSWPSSVGRRGRAATSASSRTTATRRRTRGARFAARAHVVLSNPDMVHSGILPHHPRWAKLFENLKFVVIDELHAYRGVFGSHLGEHRAAAAARLPALRIESDVHLLVGDDRESARAGRAAGRRAVRAGREERRAARREVLSVRQSAGRQRAARHSAVVSGRDAARRDRVSEARPAADRVRAEPARRRRS